jgi:4-amino-4-deoxy-L-arabinose transferase
MTESLPVKPKSNFHRAVLGLIIGFIVLYIGTLSSRPMMMPDEHRYGEIAREMLTDDDWVVPHLDGFRYFEKPVMFYWATAGSMKIFGQNAFALRLPSALSVGITALLIFLLVRRLRPDHPAVALLASGIYLTTIEVFIVGTLGIIDSMLTMFLTGVMVSFIFSYFSNNLRDKILYLVVMGIFCGGAFLSKGFLAFVVPILTIIPFLIWERKFKQILLIPWIPLIVATLVVLPWAIAIHLREGSFWHYFFWEEHVRRFIGERIDYFRPIMGEGSKHIGSDAQHAKPFWWYIPILLAGSMPWVIFVPGAFIGLRQLKKQTNHTGSGKIEKPLIRFLLCWLIVPLIFFSACKGKLPTYIIPCFVPMGILVAMGLWKYLHGEKTRAFDIGVPIASLLPIIAGLGLVVIQIFKTGFGIIPPEYIPIFSPVETGGFLCFTAGLFVWGVLGIMAGCEKPPSSRVILCLLAPVWLFTCIMTSLPFKFIEKKTPGSFLKSQVAQVDENTILVSDKRFVRSVCWYFKRNDAFLLYDCGELEWGVMAHEDSTHRLLRPISQFQKLINNLTPEQKIVLVATPDRFKGYIEAFGKPTEEHRSKYIVLGIYRYRGANRPVTEAQ